MKNDILKYPRIRDMRIDRDLSQKDVAEYLSIKQNTYSRYETNERNLPLEVIEKLADFYNTSTDYLLGRTDEQKPYSESSS